MILLDRRIHLKVFSDSQIFLFVTVFFLASLCCCILALPLVTRYGVKLTFLFGTASAAAAALFLGLLCQLSQLHDSWAGKLSAAVYIAAQVRDDIKHFCQYTSDDNVEKEALFSVYRLCSLLSKSSLIH